jgi:2-phospho-L-lactate guanylyltransferase (CobY/MobA/RfbA family)
VDAAFAAGVQPRILPATRFALDVDTPDDLRALLARGPATQTAMFLHRAGIAVRLSVPEASGAPLDDCDRDAHND